MGEEHGVAVDDGKADDDDDDGGDDDDDGSGDDDNGGNDNDGGNDGDEDVANLHKDVTGLDDVNVAASQVCFSIRDGKYL